MPNHDASQVTLEQVEPATRPVVERLHQLYRHDLSEFRDMLPDAAPRGPRPTGPGQTVDTARRLAADERLTSVL